MKKLFCILLAASVVCGILAFKTLQPYASILEELCMDPADARESIFSDLLAGSLDFPYSSVVTCLATGRHESAVKELGDYIKSYTASPEFAARYWQAREEALPQGGPSVEEKVSAAVEQLQEDIKKTRKDLVTTRGDMVRLLQVTLEQQERKLKILITPTNPEHAAYVAHVTEPREWEQQQAAEELAYWKEAFPPTVRELVRKRLQEFLTLTKDIDFNARLVKRDNKMVFVDSAMEEKSELWKRCFRCGPRTIAAARSYAQQWLVELK